MKKLFVLALTLLLMCSLLPAAYAAENPTEDTAARAAQALYDLGLFRGTGTNADGTPIFDLDKTPTRNQAVIMLVRLLGKEQEALTGNWELPFTDVPQGSTAYPYIGYAYAHGLTNGTTATTYSGANPIRTNQYITFVLRAMGYVSGEDFEVRTAWDLSDELGITDGQYTADNAGAFLRADIADISAKALSAPLKGTKKPLAEKLMEEKVFTREQYDCVVQPPEEEEEEPFTLTAFGDKWLHEYLMSLDPTNVALGPEFPGTRDYFDSYCYFDDRYIADEIAEELEKRYTYERVVPAAEDGTQIDRWSNHGTRVETLEDDVYGRLIAVSTFEPDGEYTYFTSMTYYIRWRTDRP